MDAPWSGVRDARAEVTWQMRGVDVEEGGETAVKRLILKGHRVDGAEPCADVRVSEPVLVGDNGRGAGTADDLAALLDRGKSRPGRRQGQEREIDAFLEWEWQASSQDGMLGWGHLGRITWAKEAMCDERRDALRLIAFADDETAERVRRGGKGDVVGAFDDF